MGPTAVPADGAGQGWTYRAWQQSWFGHTCEAAYLIRDDGYLQSIRLRTNARETLSAAMREALGAPIKEGSSPSVAMSERFIQWKQHERHDPVGRLRVGQRDRDFPCVIISPA